MVTKERRFGNPYIGGKLLYCIDPWSDRWLLAYDLKKVEGEEQADTPQQYSYLTELFDHRPTPEEVAECLFKPYNDVCDEKILRGFRYTTLEDTPVTRNVWLDETNQRNFLGEFTFAKLFDGVNLPTIIKMGITEEEAYYYKVISLNQYKHFILAALGHIKQCLAECWSAKQDVDLTPYHLDDNGKKKAEEAVS
jgi:hypothetical protein B2_07647